MASIDGNNFGIRSNPTLTPDEGVTSDQSVNENASLPTDEIAQSATAPTTEGFQNSFRDSIENTSPVAEAPTTEPLPPALQSKLDALIQNPKIDPKEGERLSKYVHALQQKSGDFYAELALDYLIKNPKQAKHLKTSTKAKVHKLIQKDLHRQEQAKLKLVKTLTQNVDKAVGNDASSARRLGLSTWYDAEIRTLVNRLDRVDGNTKTDLNASTQQIVAQARDNGVFISAEHSQQVNAASQQSHALPQGTLDAATGLYEIDLTDQHQLAQTLSAVVATVKPAEGANVDSFEGKALTQSLQELDFQLQGLANAEPGRDAEIRAASALNTLNNILQLDKGGLLTPTDRENLELFSTRLKEVALRPVVEAFKHQLHHELEYLDEVGSKREVYLSAKLGIGTKDVPALGTLGLSASLKVKLELRNNDYFIKEYKAFTTGLGANFGKEGGLFNFAGQLSRTQSHVKQWKSLDDFIDHHSNDILANVVNLTPKNIARLFQQKSDRDSAGELKDIEKTRASDLQRLNGRLQSLGLLDYTTTKIKDGDKVALPRYTQLREFTYAAEGEATAGFGALTAAGLAEKRTSVEEVLTPILQAAQQNPALLNRAPAAHFNSQQGDTVVNTRELLTATDQKFDALYDHIRSLEVDTTRNDPSQLLPGDQAAEHIETALSKLAVVSADDPQALNEALGFSKSVLQHIDPSSEGVSGQQLVAQHEATLGQLYRALQAPLAAETAETLVTTLDAELAQFKQFETLVLRANTTTDNWVGSLAEEGVHDLLKQRGAELGVHDYLRALSQSTAALTLTAENLPAGPQLDTVKAKLSELGGRIEKTNIYLNQEEQRHAGFNEGSRVFHRAVTKAEAKIALPLVNIGKIGIGVTGEVRWNENSIRDGRYLDIDITLPTLAQLPAAWDGLFTQLSEHGLVEHNLTGILEGDFKELLTGHGAEAAEGASGGEKVDIPLLPKFKVEAELSVKLSYQVVDGKPRLLYSHVATERAYEAGIEAEIPLGHAPVVLNGEVSVGKESTVPISFNYGTGTLQFLIGQYYYWAGADTDQIHVTDRQWHEVTEHHPNNLVTLIAHGANENHQVHKELTNLITQGTELNVLSEQEAAEYREKLTQLNALVPEGKKRADISDADYHKATDGLREFLHLGYRVHTAKNDQLRLDNARNIPVSSLYY